MESQAGPIIDLALEELTGAAPKPEPLADYQQLLDYWDFKYPPQHEARCDCCGANSLDWRSDEPRLFRLDSANLGGLVSFVCLGCKAKVIKRHFKDHVSYDCRPFVNKD